MKSIFELAAGDTTTTTVRGSSRTAYALEPTVWVKEIIDTAKKSHLVAQFAYQTMVAPGNENVIVPYRTDYLSSYESSAGEGVAINYTKLDNLNGVNIVPADKNAGIAISNKALRVNALDLVRAAKNELTYHAGDLVDIAVITALGDSTAAASGTKGAQTIYGGDARADSELAAGDIFTVDMIADAKTKLQSTTCKYWVPGTPAAEAVSSASKAPWKGTAQEPFVLLISSEQENVLLKDSQFVNASEYGSDKIIMNGEIGEYLKAKVIVSSNTESFTASGASPDGGGVAGATGHRCLLFKAGVAVALAWGLKPILRVFDYPSQLEKRLVLELSYKAESVHDDSVVFIDVADE